MIKVVHMGDAHIGYRQYGLQVREQDYENAVGYVVAQAIKIEADAFIWPGGLRRRARAVRHFLRRY